MELLAQILLWFVGRPMVATLQAIVAILYPPKSAKLKKLQWLTVGLLGAGYSGIAVGIVALSLGVGWAVSFPILATGWIVLVSAGGVGSFIERRHLEDQRTSS